MAREGDDAAAGGSRSSSSALHGAVSGTARFAATPPAPERPWRCRQTGADGSWRPTLRLAGREAPEGRARRGRSARTPWLVCVSDAGTGDLRRFSLRSPSRRCHRDRQRRADGPHQRPAQRTQVPARAAAAARDRRRRQQRRQAGEARAAPARARQGVPVVERAAREVRRAQLPQEVLLRDRQRRELVVPAAAAARPGALRRST